MDVIADPKTVKHILIDELRMIKINFKWIPRVLTLKIKAKRLKMENELFQFLTNASEHMLDMILTQDKSCFYMINQRNSMWFEASQPLPIKAKQTIGFKKDMISAIWGRKGIVNIRMIPPDEKFSKTVYFENV